LKCITRASINKSSTSLFKSDVASGHRDRKKERRRGGEEDATSTVKDRFVSVAAEQCMHGQRRRQ
jgi:hypothetical protein